MMIEIQWEMRDLSTDREWVSSVNEMDVNTLAQASTWIRQQLPERESAFKSKTIIVDGVIISAIGSFFDEDGCSTDRKWLGTYEPASDEWTWAADAKVT